MGASRPSVLFVCVKNGGKSQLAAALLRHLAGMERMRLVRDDIAARVAALQTELTGCAAALDTERNLTDLHTQSDPAVIPGTPHDG